MNVRRPQVRRRLTGRFIVAVYDDIPDYAAMDAVWQVINRKTDYEHGSPSYISHFKQAGLLVETRRTKKALAFRVVRDSVGAK